MNYQMAAILLFLTGAGLVLALRGWAKHRPRQITLAHRLLAALLIANRHPHRK
jgi:hypothetical protein